jgi:hypothetical protein
MHLVNLFRSANNRTALIGPLEQTALEVVDVGDSCLLQIVDDRGAALADRAVDHDRRI